MEIHTRKDVKRQRKQKMPAAIARKLENNRKRTRSQAVRSSQIASAKTSATTRQNVVGTLQRWILDDTHVLDTNDVFASVWQLKDGPPAAAVAARTARIPTKQARIVKGVDGRVLAQSVILGTMQRY
jgi:hypothetical protein